MTVASTACGRFSFGEIEPADAGLVEIDASSGDATALATACGTVPSLVCDGFESGTLGAWRTEIGAGNLAVVSDSPFRGDHALRATAGVGGYAYLAVDISPIVSGEVYVRGYVRVPSGVGIDAAEFVQLFRVGHESDPGHVHVMADSGDLPVVWPGANVFIGTTPIPRERWLCMTLALQLDGGAGAFELAFEGVPFVTKTGIALMSEAGGFGELSVGLVGTGSDQAQLSIDFDEVSVSTTARVCD